MRHLALRLALFVCTSMLCTSFLPGQDKPAAKTRARDLGVPFDGTPGTLNAITDVSGVTVGHTTIISGEGKLQVGKGPVRTGGGRVHTSVNAARMSACATNSAVT